MPEKSWSESDLWDSTIVDLAKIYNISSSEMQRLPQVNILRLAQLHTYGHARELLLLKNAFSDSAIVTEGDVRNTVIVQLQAAGMAKDKGVLYLQDMEVDALDQLSYKAIYSTAGAGKAGAAKSMVAAVATPIVSALAAATETDAKATASAAASRRSPPASSGAAAVATARKSSVASMLSKTALPLPGKRRLLHQ
mgnify:FL=1|jgi:hypothetical protein|tara:strand:+ start:796 stop:1380 length:585 start_codon:yes stop_codon:yes gene_type:complete